MLSIKEYGRITKTLNKLFYEDNSNICDLQIYIGKLKTNGKINMNDWYCLHNFVLNLIDY